VTAVTQPADAAAESAGALTTAELERRLFAKYHGDDFAICLGVRNSAGFNANREADALGIGLWPSRGCHLYGFEIKASRGDWLRELKSGAKAEAFFAYCDFWTLVVGDPSIVKDGELPTGWGLLVPHGKSLRQVVRPALNKDAAPMPRGMLAAFVKRAATQAPLEATLKARYAEGVAAGEARAALRVTTGERPSAELEELRAKVREFSAATGINPIYAAPQQIAEIGKALALIRQGGQFGPAASLQRLSQEVDRIAAAMRTAGETLSAEITFSPIGR
jgi:hypothetical protein